MNSAKPSWSYRFIKHFEHLIGTYFLPLALLLEGTDAIVAGQWKNFIIYIAIFYFEIFMWVLKDRKGEISLKTVPHASIILFWMRVFCFSSVFIITQLFSYSLGAAALLFIPLGLSVKMLILKNVINPESVKG